MTSYNLRVHTVANDELRDLPSDVRDRMTDTLQEVAATRSPSTHGRVKHMEGPADLLRVRVSDYRAIISLEKPDLLVLRVGDRATIYREKDALGGRLSV
jgi:Cytotoxic translational repressor of toxin-antitoxin stability system